MVGGKMTQTPREKRLQSRAERTERVQESEFTPKAATTKLKDKAPPAKQAKTVPTSSTRNQKAISTGSPKTASTGSQKLVSTGLSTGSLKKGKGKEESPKILAREAAAMLAALTTSPKQKEKQKREPSMYFKARRSTKIKTGRPKEK